MAANVKFAWYIAKYSLPCSIIPFTLYTIIDTMLTKSLNYIVFFFSIEFDQFFTASCYHFCDELRTTFLYWYFGTYLLRFCSCNPFIYAFFSFQSLHKAYTLLSLCRYLHIFLYAVLLQYIFCILVVYLAWP